MEKVSREIEEPIAQPRGASAVNEPTDADLAEIAHEPADLDKIEHDDPGEHPLTPIDMTAGLSLRARKVGNLFGGMSGG